MLRTFVVCLSCMAPAVLDASEAESKTSGLGWKGIVLDDSVFTEEQLGHMKNYAELKLLAGKKVRGEFYLGYPGSKDTKLDLAGIVKRYGRPDSVNRFSEYGADWETHRWGPIGFVVKKGETKIFQFGAPGEFFLDGLKSSVRSSSLKSKPAADSANNR